MAVPCVLAKRSVFLLTFYCTCVAVSVGSPARRQSITEATSAEPIVVTNEAVWEDSDEFDLDGNEWLKQPATSSSSSTRRGLYNEDYDDYADENLVVDGIEDDDQNDDTKGESEFLFLPPREARVIQPEDDDEDDSSQIKVRHTGRSSFSKILDDDSSIQVDHPVDVTLDDDDDDIALDAQQHDDASVQVLPQQEVRIHDDDDDDNSEEDEDDNMFDSPEEEAAEVIYGDHVFLY